MKWALLLLLAGCAPYRCVFAIESQDEESTRILGCMCADGTRIKMPLVETGR